MNDEFPIIRKLGGPKAVAEHLQSKGLIKASRTVGMWETRGKISGSGMLALMQMAESAKVTYCSDDFAKSRRNAFETHSTVQRDEVAA